MNPMRPKAVNQTLQQGTPLHVELEAKGLRSKGAGCLYAPEGLPDSFLRNPFS